MWYFGVMLYAGATFGPFFNAAQCGELRARYVERWPAHADQVLPCWHSGSAAIIEDAPAPVPTPPVPPTTPALKATLLTAIDDKVGELLVQPSGKNDIRIRIDGIAKQPTKVRIVSKDRGVWEWPYNGDNWIIGIQWLTTQALELRFEPFGDVSAGYSLTLTHDDGRTTTLMTQ